MIRAEISYGGGIIENNTLTGPGEIGIDLVNSNNLQVKSNTISALGMGPFRHASRGRSDAQEPPLAGASRCSSERAPDRREVRRAHTPQPPPTYPSARACPGSGRRRCPG